MAQYFYSAADANILDNLTKVRGNGTVSVATDLAEASLEFLSGNNDTIFTVNTVPPGASFELVYLRRTVTSDTGAQLGMGKYMATELTLTSIGYSAGTGLVRSSGGSRTTLGILNGLVTDPTVYHYTRIQVTDNGDGTTTIRARCWDFGDTEPAAWAITRTDSTTTHQVSGIPCFYNDNNVANYVRWFGVGTNGDPAPTEPVGPLRLESTLEQQGEVASNLSIAGTVPVRLSATLEQQARVRGFSNELSIPPYGIYNPGTEANGPLDWPYVYSPTQNEIVLQSGRFVGTTDLAATNSYMGVPLAELGTAPFTDYSVGAKTRSRAETQLQGLRLGLSDSVSGAQAYVEVWDKNWYLEFYDGVSNGGSDSGTLEFPVNDFSLGYTVSTGRFLLYINNSGASNSLEQLGLSFDSAFCQVNSGGESVSWFEELRTATVPSNYSPAILYIPGSDSTIESGSEALASLQVGAGRRLQALAEQGSTLQAEGKLAIGLASSLEQQTGLEPKMVSGLPLAATLVQESALSVAERTALPMTVSVEQGSDLQSKALVAAPLAGTLEQGSALVSQAGLGLRLSATIEQGSATDSFLRRLSGQGLQAVLGQQSVVESFLRQTLPLATTVEQESALQTAARIAMPLASSLEQDSVLQAGLKLATEMRLSATVEQTAALLADSVVGVRLGALVYGDSDVSAALPVGLPLYSTIDQPATVLGALADTTAIRLSSEINAPATLSATLTGTTTVASEAILEQGSTLSVSMTVAVPAGPSLLEQSSSLQVALKVSIPLAATVEQSSALAAALQTPLRLAIAIAQGSELSEATLETGKRFNTIVSTQTALAVEVDAPRFVGQTFASLEQETELAASLKLSMRFRSVLPQPQAALLAIPKAERSLKLAPIQNAGLVRAMLRVPAVGSTGWLTVSDIFFHNDYYSEVVFEQVPASEIALVPALRIDTLSIMPA